MRRGLLGGRSADGDRPLWCHVCRDPTARRPDPPRLVGPADAGAPDARPAARPDRLRRVLARRRAPVAGDYRIAAPTPAATGAHRATRPSSWPRDPIELMYRDTVDVVSEVCRAAAPRPWSWSGTRWAVASRRPSRHATPSSCARRSLEDPAWFEQVSVVQTGTRARCSAWRSAAAVPRRPRRPMDQGRAENARWPGVRARRRGRGPRPHGDLGFLATGLAILRHSRGTTIAAGDHRADPRGHRHATT